MMFSKDGKQKQYYEHKECGYIEYLEDDFIEPKNW